MNNESDLWNCESYLDNGANNATNGYRWPQASNPAWSSNNEETVYLLFGHYTEERCGLKHPRQRLQRLRRQSLHALSGGVRQQRRGQ